MEGQKVGMREILAIDDSCRPGSKGVVVCIDTSEKACLLTYQKSDIAIVTYTAHFDTLFVVWGD